MKDVVWDNLTLENNNLIGANDVINNIKTTYSDLFVQKTADGNDPKDTGNSNNNGGSNEFDFSKF